MQSLVKYTKQYLIIRYYSLAYKFYLLFSIIIILAEKVLNQIKTNCNSQPYPTHLLLTNGNKSKQVNSFLYLALQPKQLTPAEIADVAHHFAVNNQGSELFWDTLQRATVDQLSNFNREQLATVFDAMMKTPYEVPDDVGEAVTKAIDTFFFAELEANQKSDPYYLSKFLFQFQAGLGQFALNFGPGFLTGRVNDEHPEQNLAKGDYDLSESSNSELRSAFIKGELNQEQVQEEKTKFLNRITELLGKNQNAQDVTNLK